LPDQDKKPDHARQPREQADHPAGLREGAEERAMLESQLSGRNEPLDGQAEQLQLRRELDQAHSRDMDAAQKIELLEREKTEILAVLDRVNRSVAWKLVKRYRRAKERLLPLGTLRRRLYDRWMVRLRNSQLSQTSQLSPQVTPQKSAGPIAAPTKALLVLLSGPAVLEAGETGIGRVVITNLSEHRWEAAKNGANPQGSVRLSYHWYDHFGGILRWGGERADLPHDVGPQDSVTVDMRVLAPFDPGTYTLEITLVREGIDSFDQKGSTGPRLSVRVETSQTHLPEFPSCSIVIPVFNRAVFTKACLLAIDRSVAPARLPYEVIVVDNGSTDETLTLLSSWSQSRANARVVSMGQNLGFARACNEGARLARGRYIVFLNNDTLPTPGWLEKMVELAEEEPRVGIVGSKLLFPNGRIQHIGVAFDKNKNPEHIYRGFPADIPPARISREFQAITGACLLVAGELYHSVGGMDESYESSYEDADLCLKVRDRGFRVFVCADSVLYHFESISEGRHTADFRNSALFKTRWENRIESDTDRWYATDKRRGDEYTEMEAPEASNSEQESILEELWERVYSCELSECEFHSKPIGLSDPGRGERFIG
jgi:GT2 family glycosyltransferase